MVRIKEDNVLENAQYSIWHRISLSHHVFLHPVPVSSLSILPAPLYIHIPNQVIPLPAFCGFPTTYWANINFQNVALLVRVQGKLQ